MVFMKKDDDLATSFYDGDWVDDQRHGQGKSRNGCGDIFIGDFRDGKINGRVKIIYKA